MSLKNDLEKSVNNFSNSTKPAKTSLRNDLNNQTQYSTALFSKGYLPTGGITPVGKDIGTSDYDYRIPEAEALNLNLIRATRQPGTHQLGIALSRGVLSGLFTAIENTSLMLDFENNIKDMMDVENVESNFIADWAKENKEYLRENMPIYRKNPNETIDFSDSGFYYDALSSVLDSAVGFGITGIGAGALMKGAGTLLKAATRVGQLSKADKIRGYFNGIGNSLQNGTAGTFGAAYISNFGEGKMMGLELYNTAFDANLTSMIADYQAKNGGAEPDEKTLIKMQKTASDIAGKRADIFMNFNKLMVIPEMLQLAGIFKATGMHKTRNMMDKPGFASVAKQQIKQAPIEAGEEIFANVLSQEQQYGSEQDLAKLGYKIKDPISTNMDMVSRLIDFATSDQALLEGAMGLISGPIQYTITGLPFENSTLQKKRYDEQQTQLKANRQFFDDKLALIVKKHEAKQEAIDTGNDLYAEHIEDREFDLIAVENFSKGTTQNLADILQDELKSDKYSDTEKEKIQSKIERLAELEGAYTQYSKYATASLLMNNKLDRESDLSLLNKLKSKSTEAVAEVEKTFSPILEALNKNKTPEETITLSDIMHEISSMDYVKFTEAYKKFQTENKNEDGSLKTPTIQEIINILETTNPTLFDNLNKNKDVKDLLINNESVLSLIANQAAIANIEGALAKSVKTENSLKSPIYNMGFEDLQSILYSNKDTETKISDLNKLAKKTSSNEEITNLINTSRAKLENDLETAKQTNSASDDEATANKKKVDNVKNTTKPKRTPKNVLDKLGAEQEGEGIETEESSIAEDSESEDISQLAMEEDEGLIDFKNQLLSNAMHGKGDKTTAEVIALTDDELRALKESTPEDEGLTSKEDLEEIKRAIAENNEAFVETMPILPSVIVEDVSQLKSPETGEFISKGEDPVNPSEIGKVYPEVHAHNQSTVEVNKTLEKDTTNVIADQDGVKLVSNSPSASFLNWVLNGENKKDAEVTYEIAENISYNDPSTKTALATFKKLKAHYANPSKNKKPSETEISEMVNNLPIAVKLKSDPTAYSYLYKVRVEGNGIAAKLERQLRTQIITNTINGVPSEGKVNNSYGGDLAILPDNVADRSIKELYDFENMDSKDIELYYVDKEGAIRSVKDHSLSKFKNKVKSKATGLPLSGAVFTAIKKANGELFPLKLNVKPLNTSEIQFITTLYRDLLAKPVAKEIGEVVINKLETKVPEELLALLNPADREFLKDATYSEALTYMVFEGENSKSNVMTQLYISKGKLYFGGEVMNLSDFADASKLNLIQEFLATYKTRNINLKKLADPKETAYKTHVIDNGLLTTNAGFETEYDANNKPISKKGEASNPKTLFKSLDLQVYSTKEEKMSNRFRQATVYVNPSLNNPSELVKPTEEVKTKTPATQSEIDARKADIERIAEEDRNKLIPLNPDTLIPLEPILSEKDAAKKIKELEVQYLEELKVLNDPNFLNDENRGNEWEESAKKLEDKLPSGFVVFVENGKVKIEYRTKKTNRLDFVTIHTQKTPFKVGDKVTIENNNGRFRGQVTRVSKEGKILDVVAMEVEAESTTVDVSGVPSGREVQKSTKEYLVYNGKILNREESKSLQKINDAELKALESKPLESSEKSSILSPLNTTETIIEQQEKLKENMTDISSPVTREPNKINLEANQEAITKQKESLTKNTMSAAEKLAARKKDCNKKK